MAGPSIKHRFQSGIPDSTDPADANKVRPSHWDDTHKITLDSGYAIGRKSPGNGDAEQLSGADLVGIIGNPAIVNAIGYTPANIAGDTFTGPVVLNADPAVPLGASTKQYVDTAIAGISTTFTQGGTGAVTRTMQNKVRESVSVMDFGATGNGTTDDTTAISNAITYIQSNGLGGTVFFPAGNYKITSALPDITKSVYLEGASPFATRLQLTGNFNMIAFRGSGSRCQYAGLRNLLINGSGMTNTYAVQVDWAQGIYFENILIKSVSNGVRIQQAGQVTFIGCNIFDVQGSFGVLCYGTSTARNGENDQIDVVSFFDTIIQGNYVTGVGTNTTACLALDGRVQTVQFDGLRLLSAGKGISTSNSPGVAGNLVPRFLVGSDLEIEDMYICCADFSVVMDVDIDFFFAARAAANDGVILGAGCSNFRLKSGVICSNYGHGINITSGASNIYLNNLQIYNNSLVGGGTKSGVYCQGSGNITAHGGKWGKNTSIPAYTEPQKYGCEMDAAYTGLIRLHQVNLGSNATGGLFDSGGTSSPSRVLDCPGYNPRGAAAVTATGSPMTYTAGLTTEHIQLIGGTVSSVTIGGVTVGSSTNISFTLQPRQAAVITYTVAPTIAAMRA